jgi:hypothetical protein
MFLGLPDPLVRGMDPYPDPSIIKQKYLGKTFISTVLLLLYDFLSFKNDVNASSKSMVISKKKLASSKIKLKKLEKIAFCWCLEGKAVNETRDR